MVEFKFKKKLWQPYKYYSTALGDLLDYLRKAVDPKVYFVLVFFSIFEKHSFLVVLLPRMKQHVLISF